MQDCIPACYTDFRYLLRAQRHGRKPLCVARTGSAANRPEVMVICRRGRGFPGVNVTSATSRRPGPQTQDHSDCILTANAVQDCPSASTVADSEGETEQGRDLRRDATPRCARRNGDEDRPRAPWTSLSRALTASLNCSMVRRVLLQGIVNAIVMVVVHVCSDQPVEMPFVQRDDLVE